MSKFPKVALIEVAEFTRGLTYTKSDEVDFSSNVVLRANNVDLNSGTILYENLKYLRDSFHIPREKKVKPGSLIICTASGSKSHLGKVALIPESIDMAFGGFMGMLSPRDGLDGRYLYYALRSPMYLDFISKVTDGANINNLKFSDLGLFEFPLPPLDEQKRIVAKLDGVVEHSRQLQAISARRHEKAESLASSIRASLLAPGRGWDLKSLKDVATIFDGPHATPRKTKSGPWYLSITSLRDGELDLSKSAHLSESDFPAWTKRTEVLPGDTLFSYETRLGQAALWQRTEPAALGRRMGLLRPNASILPEFLTASYLGPGFQEQIRQRTTEGATVDRIPIANMADWPIWVPPLDQQRELVDRLRKLTDLLRAQANISLAKDSQLIDLSAHIISSVLSDAA